MKHGRELLIVGTGGLAKEVAQLSRQIDPEGSRWSAISYVAPSIEMLGEPMSFGTIRWHDSQVVEREKPCDVAIGVGSPSLRRRLAQTLLQNQRLSFPNLVHPLVELDKEFVKLGRGNIVTKGVIVTCDVSIGDFNFLNLNVTVGHDAVIGSHNVFNPSCNISGNATIGDDNLFGTGCQVLENIGIASGVTIGAGAVVTRLILDAGTYVGIPARRVG